MNNDNKEKYRKIMRRRLMRRRPQCKTVESIDDICKNQRNITDFVYIEPGQYLFQRSRSVHEKDLQSLIENNDYVTGVDFLPCKSGVLKSPCVIPRLVRNSASTLEPNKPFEGRYDDQTEDYYVITKLRGKNI